MATNEQKIKCPKCGKSISIDAVLAHQIEEKIKDGLKVEQKAKELELRKKLAEVKKKELEIAEAKKTVDNVVAEKVAEQLAVEKAVIIRSSKLKANKEKEAEFKILEEQLKEKEQKLSVANAEALKLRIERQNLEAEKKEFELKIQRQLDEERKKIEENANIRAAEAEHYKIAQLEKKLSDALKANEEQKRKLEQGSQQTQGEVLELELEDLLKQEFHQDEILEVAKGANGTDIIQKVADRLGNTCGQIVWESKKTKAWNEAWIQKLKEDQRNAKADLAVIVSIVLPSDVKGFSFREGVFICDIHYVINLAKILRYDLLKITEANRALIGKNEKTELVYAYINSLEFRQRIQAEKGVRNLLL